jgi:hypothetical protein
MRVRSCRHGADPFKKVSGKRVSESSESFNDSIERDRNAGNGASIAVTISSLFP